MGGRAVIFGAGNIGRGFLGQLFWESGYEVIFVEAVPELVEQINERRSYPIRMVRDDYSTEIWVSGVRAVSALDPEQVAQELIECDIAATAVGVRILPAIAPVMARGLEQRMAAGKQPLNVIICENVLDADQILRTEIRKYLPTTLHEQMDNELGLVEASIGRMVPLMTPEMKDGDSLRICVEEYCELPVDRAGFKGEIPKIAHMNPVTPFDYYIERKLFMHNAAHVITAYLGFLHGHDFIWQAIGDPWVRGMVEGALMESGQALVKQYGVEYVEVADHQRDLLRRFANRALGDTVNRVGRDPLRKLGPRERLVGAATLAIKHGIHPICLAAGIAAGLLFCDESDPAAKQIQDLVADEGPEYALLKTTHLTSRTELFPLVMAQYERLQHCVTHGNPTE